MELSAPTIHELSTPCLLLDGERLERNLEKMQERADREGAALRPHTKTHKSVQLARRQLELGAKGVTVAKLGEAERFVAAGLDDVLVAYPLLGAEKHRRLLALQEHARVTFCVESETAAAEASRFFAAHRSRAGVLLEIDCGYRRVGVDWESPEAETLAARIEELPGLELRGLLTHAGQAYSGPDRRTDGSRETPAEALRRYSDLERDRMLEVGERVAQVLGRDDLDISIGSTPTMSVFESRERRGRRVTEIRPGNYAFFDRTQVALGSARVEDCALTVLATVVSRHHDPEGWRLVLDAGRKILTSDLCGGGEAAASGYGLVLDAESQEPLAETELYSLSEEHARVRMTADGAPALGERVRIVPNHSCVAANTQDRYYLIEQGVVAYAIEVDNRGRVR